jgi:membrane protein DedA with SNARE-associated domain
MWFIGSWQRSREARRLKPAEGARPSRLTRFPFALVLLLSALVVMLALLALSTWISAGHFEQVWAAAGQLARSFVARFGPAASLVLLYLEESGIPLPVPGDVYVAYLGHIAGSPLRWLAAWIGIVIAVVAGASNLYLISRRWGRRLTHGRLGAAVHLTPHGLATAERWFARWGPLAIIFGRHIPGFRIPITVGVGIFGVPYRTFAACVAVSTGTWAAIWLWLGAHFGARIGHFMGVHRWTFVVAGLLILAVVASALIRVLRAGAPQPAEEA